MVYHCYTVPLTVFFQKYKTNKNFPYWYFAILILYPYTYDEITLQLMFVSLSKTANESSTSIVRYQSFPFCLNSIFQDSFKVKIWSKTALYLELTYSIYNNIKPKQKPKIHLHMVTDIFKQNFIYCPNCDHLELFWKRKLQQRMWKSQERPAELKIYQERMDLSFPS